MSPSLPVETLPGIFFLCFCFSFSVFFFSLLFFFDFLFTVANNAAGGMIDDARDDSGLRAFVREAFGFDLDLNLDFDFGLGFKLLFDFSLSEEDTDAGGAGDTKAREDSRDDDEDDIAEDENGVEASAGDEVRMLCPYTSATRACLSVKDERMLLSEATHSLSLPLFPLFSTPRCFFNLVRFKHILPSVILISLF